MDTLWSAIGFLTTLPVPGRHLHLDRRTALWFPFVGLLIGALLAGASIALSWLLPPTIVAVFVVAAWVALTGALHLDGLADCGDGLLPPVARERRLEIMRDPRVGAFGVTALVLVLMLKTAALTALPSMWPALLVAPLWARWSILVAMQRPSARPDGLGAAQQMSLTMQQIVLLALLPVIVTVVAGLWQWQLWLAAAASIAVLVVFLRFVEQRLGGVTGDVFGAVVEVSETIVLCVACIRLAPV